MKDNFVSKGYMKNHGYKFVSFENEECILEADIKENSLNPYDIAHGGFIYGLMDTCGGVHINLETNKLAVTISSNINYLKPGKGSKITAKSKITRMGTRIIFCSIECYNDKDELIANGLFNYNFIK